MAIKTGRTAQIDRYGPPDVLHVAETRLAPVTANEVRVRVLAAGINYTDLQIRAGVWPTRSRNPFPYTPGIEAVGVIESIGSTVSGWAAGQTVITMMQGLGGVRAERPGGYAEFVTVDADALALVPVTVDPLVMAAVGLPGVTAYGGLRRIGSDLEGRRILVTGAVGNVGSCALGVAKAQGAVVVGLVSRASQVEAATAYGADEVIVSEKDNPTALGDRAFDGVLDAVGGPLFSGCVTALRSGGVYSMIGAVAGGTVSFDAWKLIEPVVLTGYSTETLDGASLRSAISDLTRWLQEGTIAPPHCVALPLQDVAAVHSMIETGDLPGRVLLRP